MTPLQALLPVVLLIVSGCGRMIGPEPVMAALRASKVREVHVIGRRGPAQAKFTTKELRELGELAGVHVSADAAELDLSEGYDRSGESAELAASDRRVRGNLVAMAGWGEPASGQLECVEIAVDSDDAHLGRAAQDRLAVSAQAEGCVDDHRAGTQVGRRDERDDPIEHHRDVEGKGHDRC